MRQVALLDLQAFVAVAKHRSFRRAATERQVSPSSLSQTVSRLEEQLGVRLLNRTTRSVGLTEAGEELFGSLTSAFTDISEAVERLNGFRSSVSGTLRLNAPLPVAHLLLAPIIADFLAEHPSVSVDLAAHDAFVDTIKEGFDAGLRFGESLAQDMIAVRLGLPQRMIVVVSPEHLRTSGRPTTPTELNGKSLIRHRFPGGMIFPWEFEKDNETATIVPAGPLTVNDPIVKIRAAINGVGYAYEFEGYARDAIEKGELVTVLEEWCPAFPGPYLYYSNRKHVPLTLRAFIEFAKRRFAATERGKSA